MRMAKLPCSCRAISMLMVALVCGFVLQAAVQLRSSRYQTSVTTVTRTRQGQDLRLDLDILDDKSIPNLVHYVWCERKMFEFRHYLSVLSVVRFIQPERIIFYMAHTPRKDDFLYNDWYDRLLDESAYFEVKSIDGYKHLCDTKEQRLKVIKDTVKNGGIYMHEDIILSQFPAELRKADLFSTCNDNVACVLAVKPNFWNKIKLSKPQAIGVSNIQPTCLTPPQYDNSPDVSYSSCVMTSKTIYPRDFWWKTNFFSQLVNSLFYNQNEIARPVKSEEELVPNIAHLVWVGGNQMNFLFYMCCLSLLHVVKVEVVYIHGDREPTGPYWTKISQDKRIRFKKAPLLLDYVFGQKVKGVTHISDIYRAELMFKYGGIYSDADVIWAQPIPDELRMYDAVASYDWPEMYNTWPDYINFGITLGKPGAPFWKLFRDSMRKFKDDFFGYNGLLMPYKVYENHPNLVYVYDRLQVMCWHLKCHPTWVKDFRFSNASHLTMKSELKWNDSIAWHWTHPDPAEFKDQKTLLNSTGLFADIGKRVLQAAGLL